MEIKLSTDQKAPISDVKNPSRDTLSLVPSTQIADKVLEILDEQSAEKIVKIDIRGKSSIADFMIVASGRSNRHVGALADYVQRGLKELGHDKLGVEGLEQCDWVLVDAGDVILHLFRPEVREFYALEKMWTVPAGSDDASDGDAPSTPS